MPDKTEGSLPVPENWNWRVILGLAIVVLPLVSVLGIGTSSPTWQSGQNSDFAELYLSVTGTLPFVPFLFYSAGCFILLLIAPIRLGGYFPIRFGIYTGTLLALHYCILLFVYEEVYGVLATIGSFVFLLLYSKIVKDAVYAKVVVLISLGLVLIILKFTLVLVLVFFGLMFTPFFCFVVGATTSAKLLKQYEQWPLGWLKSGMTVVWLGLYGVAWQMAYERVMAFYSALPLVEPSIGHCYVVTAAARGHRPIVKSQPIRLANGHEMLVNEQLRRLKAGEILLMVLLPQVHRPLRRWYDRWGPVVAKWCFRPIIADLVYLLLKPIEWLTLLILKICVPDSAQLIAKLYNPE